MPWLLRPCEPWIIASTALIDHSRINRLPVDVDESILDVLKPFPVRINSSQITPEFRRLGHDHYGVLLKLVTEKAGYRWVNNSPFAEASES